MTISHLLPNRERCRYSTNGSERTNTVAMSQKIFSTVTSCQGWNPVSSRLAARGSRLAARGVRDERLLGLE
jgi:hypothetical protein